MKSFFCLGLLFLFLLDGNQTRAQQVFADGFSKVSAIQVSPQGSVYILDAQTSVLGKYRADSSLEYSVGTVGFGQNRFDDPTDLFYGGLRLLVCDMENHRLVQYDRNLQYLGEINEKSDLKLKNWLPFRAVALRTGEIFVLDAYSKALHLFDENGALRFSVPLPDEIRIHPKIRLDLLQNELRLVDIATQNSYHISALGKYELFTRIPDSTLWFGFISNMQVRISSDKMLFFDETGKKLLRTLSLNLSEKEVANIIGMQIAERTLYLALTHKVLTYSLDY